MTIKNCPKCGGTHYGSHVCPYTDEEIEAMTKKPILCIDFDGVVHAYTSPWTNEHTISDGPVPGALRWLWKATEWFNIVIYSSRSKTEQGRRAMKVWMQHNSTEEFGHDHPMAEGNADSPYPIDFASEKPAAFLTIDDRAVCFEGDWSELDPCAMLDFKPWNKRPKPTVQSLQEILDGAK